MKTLTNKEEEIMNHYWNCGEMQIRELQTRYDEPKPHVNTLSTMVHILEDKGFLSHKALTAKCFKYYPVISRDDYSRGTLANVVRKFFGKSYMSVVSTLVSNDEISIDELEALVRQIKKQKAK